MLEINEIITQAKAFEADLKHLELVYQLQGKLHVERQSGADYYDLFKQVWPEYHGQIHPYASILARAKSSHDPLTYFGIRLALILALAPYLQPEILDPLQAGDSKGRPFTEYGGLVPAQGSGFLPSVQTCLFLLSGKNLDLRVHFAGLFQPDSFLIKNGLLTISTEAGGNEPARLRIMPTRAFLHSVLNTSDYVPDFGNGFPAKRIQSQLSWEDLVVSSTVMDQVQYIRQWLAHSRTLMEDVVLGKRLKPGYRALFFGPPGAGKTLTAILLGKEMDLPVYRVDLSQVVSKYIGETEKNLHQLFEEAAGKNWILFFDEADALFGKRTQNQSAHDRYANQEVSYLLQKVEDHPGFVILASNLRANIDEAFVRRFQSIIHFEAPRYADRLKLWRLNEPDSMRFAPEVDLEIVARKYELTGAHIVNIVQLAMLETLGLGAKQISLAVLTKAIRQELFKEERHVAE